MKRIATAALLLTALLTLTACGNDGSGQSGESSPAETTTVTTKSAGEKIGDGISGIGSGIGGLVDGIQGGSDSDRTNGEAISDAISDIGGGIGSVVDGASDFGSKANEAGGEFIRGAADTLSELLQ